MCGPTQGLERSEWPTVMTEEGEFVIPNFSMITIAQAMVNYQVDHRDDAIMAQDGETKPVLIYPSQILSVLLKPK